MQSSLSLLLNIKIYYFRVWSIRYNHFHDQLVLTSSSDSQVILTSVASISSEPLSHMMDDDPNQDDAVPDTPKEKYVWFKILESNHFYN